MMTQIRKDFEMRKEKYFFLYRGRCQLGKWEGEKKFSIDECTFYSTLVDISIKRHIQFGTDFAIRRSQEIDNRFFNALCFYSTAVTAIANRRAEMNTGRNERMKPNRREKSKWKCVKLYQYCVECFQLFQVSVPPSIRIRVCDLFWDGISSNFD